MAFLTNIWRDLVDKRLVPVLAALVVALVAVPIAFGGGGGDDAADGPLPIASSGGPRPAVSIDESERLESDAQQLLNPFQQQHVPKPAPTTTSSSAGDADKGSGNSGGSKPGGGSNSGADGEKKTSSALSDDYKLSVKFGAPGATKSKTLYSMSPLPGADDPFIVFLGVQPDGKTVVFLLSTDAKPTGDGICSPSETNCQKIEMIKGDIELFDVSDESGSAATQYELELVSVKKR